MMSVFVASLDEVSTGLGPTERQWRTYAKRPGFPAKVPGKGYDLAAFAAWKAENIKPAGTGDLAAKKAAKLDLEAEGGSERGERKGSTRWLLQPSRGGSERGQPAGCCSRRERAAPTDDAAPILSVLAIQETESELVVP